MQNQTASRYDQRERRYGLKHANSGLFRAKSRQVRALGSCESTLFPLFGGQGIQPRRRRVRTPDRPLSPLFGSLRVARSTGNRRGSIRHVSFHRSRPKRLVDTPIRSKDRVQSVFLRMFGISVGTWGTPDGQGRLQSGPAVPRNGHRGTRAKRDKDIWSLGQNKAGVADHATATRAGSFCQTDTVCTIYMPILSSLQLLT